jgi:hypothetical protein
MTKSSLPESENAMQNLTQTRAKCCEKGEFTSYLGPFLPSFLFSVFRNFVFFSALKIMKKEYDWS